MCTVGLCALSIRFGLPIQNAVSNAPQELVEGLETNLIQAILRSEGILCGDQFPIVIEIILRET